MKSSSKQKALEIQPNFSYALIFSTMLNINIHSLHPFTSPLSCSSLLLCPFEDLDVTCAHVVIIAHRFKGSAGPTGWVSTHCQDALLRFRNHNLCIRDSVADLTRDLAISIIDWSSIQPLLSYCP